MDLVQLHAADELDAASLNQGQAVRNHLENVLRSKDFDGSIRSRQFLRFVVEESLAGRRKNISQITIAMQVFGRSPDFDAMLDPIVRVQAGRLRRSLERYYLLTGDDRGVCIQLPKGCYAPVFSGPDVNLDAKPPAPCATVTASVSPAGTEWPAIRVYPLAADENCQASAARFKDELVMELCRYDDVRVLRRSAINIDANPDMPARFELRASMRVENSDTTVSAHLVDRRNGRQIWSDLYRIGKDQPGWSSSVANVARVTAARISGETGVLARVLAADYGHRSGETADHFGPIARTYRFLFSREPNELIPTIQAIRSLTQREPEMEAGWSYLARLFVLNHSLQLSSLYTPVEKAIEFASRAVMLDPGSTRARSILATALLVKDEVAAAREELQQVLQLSPDSFVCRETAGWLLALSGDWENGVALMREVMERNPYCLPLVHHGLWAWQVHRGDYEAAYRMAQEYRDPGFFWRELMLACSLGLLGRSAEARVHVSELLLLKPQFQAHGRTLIGNYLKPAELRDRVAEGLGKAGLPLR